MISFRTEVYANIDMFDDIAMQLLKMMGHSGTVPGALVGKDVPRALANLQNALAGHKGEPADNLDEDEDQHERNVSLAHRAFPLVELLNAAASKNADVMWKKI